MARKKTTKRVDGRRVQHRKRKTAEIWEIPVRLDTIWDVALILGVVPDISGTSETRLRKILDARVATGMVKHIGRTKVSHYSLKLK